MEKENAAVSPIEQKLPIFVKADIELSRFLKLPMAAPSPGTKSLRDNWRVELGFVMTVVMLRVV